MRVLCVYVGMVGCATLIGAWYTAGAKNCSSAEGCCVGGGADLDDRRRRRHQKRPARTTRGPQRAHRVAARRAPGHGVFHPVAGAALARQSAVCTVTELRHRFRRLVAHEHAALVVGGGREGDLRRTVDAHRDRASRSDSRRRHDRDPVRRQRGSLTPASPCRKEWCVPKKARAPPTTVFQEIGGDRFLGDARGRRRGLRCRAEEHRPDRHEAHRERDRDDGEHEDPAPVPAPTLGVRRTEGAEGAAGTRARGRPRGRRGLKGAGGPRCPARVPWPATAVSVDSGRCIDAGSRDPVVLELGTKGRAAAPAQRPFGRDWIPAGRTLHGERSRLA